MFACLGVKVFVVFVLGFVLVQVLSVCRLVWVSVCVATHKHISCLVDLMKESTCISICIIMNCL